MIQQFHFWVYSQIIESRVSKRYLYVYVHSTIIYNSQKVEANQVSINKWTDKYTCNCILYNLKKSGNLDNFSNMYETWGYFTKWNKQSHTHTHTHTHTRTPYTKINSKWIEVTYATLWTIAHQASLSMGFSWQEYLSGLLFPPPGDLPDPGSKPMFPASSTLQVNSLLLSHQGSSPTTYM